MSVLYHDIFLYVCHEVYWQWHDISAEFFKKNILQHEHGTGLGCASGWMIMVFPYRIIPIITDYQVFHINRYWCCGFEVRDFWRIKIFFVRSLPWSPDVWIVVVRTFWRHCQSCDIYLPRYSELKRYLPS